MHTQHKRNGTTRSHSDTPPIVSDGRLFRMTRKVKHLRLSSKQPQVIIGSHSLVLMGRICGSTTRSQEEHSFCLMTRLTYLPPEGCYNTRSPRHGNANDSRSTKYHPQLQFAKLPNTHQFCKRPFPKAHTRFPNAAVDINTDNVKRGVGYEGKQATVNVPATPASLSIHEDGGCLRRFTSRRNGTRSAACRRRNAVGPFPPAISRKFM